MAHITIDIGAAGNAQRILDAMAANYGYQSTIPDPATPGATLPNPVTKAVFARNQVVRFLKDNVRAYEIGLAIKAAANIAAAKADTEVTIA